MRHIWVFRHGSIGRVSLLHERWQGRGRLQAEGVDTVLAGSQRRPGRAGTADGRGLRAAAAEVLTLRLGHRSCVRLM